MALLKKYEKSKIYRCDISDVVKYANGFEHDRSELSPLFFFFEKERQPGNVETICNLNLKGIEGQHGNPFAWFELEL